MSVTMTMLNVVKIGSVKVLIVMSRVRVREDEE